MLLLAALLLLPTAVSADEPKYTFVLTANGADSCRAAAGDIVTVTLAVRCDSGSRYLSEPLWEDEATGG